MSLRLAAVGIATLLPLAALAAPSTVRSRASGLATEVVTVNVRPEVTVRYLAVFNRKAKPVAAVVLFSGGNGTLRLGARSSLGTGRKNFLVRSRETFARQDLYVAVVDVPSDQQSGLNGEIRRSLQYAQDIARVIAEVRRRANAPVWLVGTSSGTISAAGVAARLPLQSSSGLNDDRPNGIVLTSTQTSLVDNLCGRTVFDATLAAINVPLLVVAHRDDRCPCSPAADSRKVIAALTASPAKEVVTFEGRSRPSPPSPAACEALTPHGYLGIEEAVVRRIAAWIKRH